MTAPRRILADTAYFVTRRCSERRFFLRPSELTNDIFLFVLAVAARRYGVKVHAFCVLSNHYHLLVTDEGAVLPAFVQYLDALVARATNASLGRWEGFWSSGASYSAVTPGSADDFVRKAAYVLANPVAAGLVERARDWPGLRTAPEQLGTAKLRVARPKIFFREDGDMPEFAELDLALPPGFGSAAELQKRVAAAVRDLEVEARSRMAAAGRSFLGRARVLAQDPFARPVRREKRRKLNPRVAAADSWKRMEVLTRLKHFLRAHREAWLARRAGEPNVVFPAGTYLMRFEPGIRIAALA